jgi:hypothetical protein
VWTLVVSACSVPATAQLGPGKPVAQLPLTYIDTTWNPPTGGTTWAVHTPAQLSTALQNSVPGDNIVLDAGATYTGYFALNAKSNPNNKWIYIMSSAIANLPPGTRVSPTNAASMAKIVTPNVAAAFQINGGANHYRLAGLELTSNSSYCQTGRNCMTYFLVGSQSRPTPLPDSIVIDRCYIHGAPNLDIQSGVTMNGSNYAVIDSYISDIHEQGFDANAVGAYDTPGPLKVVDNFLSAAGENIIFGGSGGNANRGVPSDIEIRNNYLFKPLAWVPLSLPPINSMVEKNAVELKSAQRVLIDSNVIQNVWAAGQNGYAIVLTVRTSQSGDFAVVNDITITNNILNNVVAGINTLAKDDQCGPGGGYPNCYNAGSQDRWYIANNVMLFYDPTQQGGFRDLAIALQPGLDRINNNTPGIMRDVVFQHNTAVSAASTPCWNSVYFGAAQQKLPYLELTNNIWLLDNALCRQPSGENGLQGTSGLTQYMGYPSTSPNDLTHRFYGNVMWVPPGDRLQTFPTGNLAQTAGFTYVNPSTGDYQLLTPYWTTTSDGQLSGVNNNNLPAVMEIPPDDGPEDSQP